MLSVDDRIITSVRQGDNNKQKVFLAKALFSYENVVQSFPSFFDVLHCSSLFIVSHSYFSLDL
jgi:hypothetical protein